jgi:hypothetical protein
MAIPRGQNHILPVRYCRDSGQDAAGTPIHQKKGLFRAVQPGRPLLRLPDDSFSLMQIVESVYLRNIYPKNIGKSFYPAVPFMPRHMIRIIIRLSIIDKTVI